MLIAQYFDEFIFYSFLGWIWESIYCTAKEKHWQDRGFLFGPVCPIYGSCVVAASLIFRFVPGISGPSMPAWGIFLISMAGSAIAEFSTSWVLEKRFHARWWDYSNMPLNIQGRICLPVSIAFGLAGVVIIKYLLPVVSGVHSRMPGLAYEGIALVLAMIFGADFALTEASLSALLADIEAFHKEFNNKAENTLEKIQSTPKQLAEGLEAGRVQLTEELAAKKIELTAGIAEKKEQLFETAEQNRLRLEEHKDQLTASAEERMQRYEAQKTQMKNAAAEKGKRLQAMAARHARGLSAGSRHALRNIVSFRPKPDTDRFNGKTAAEHLKDALKKLEEK